MSNTIASPVVAQGDRIKALDVPSVPHANGKIAVVDRVYESGGLGDAPYVTARFPEYVDDDGVTRATTIWSVTRWERADEVVETDIVTPEPVSREEYDRVVAERDRYRSSVAEAHRAFEVASRILIDEANNRGWCDSYDQIIDTINGEMPGPYAFEIRETEYEVEVTINASVSYSTTVTVTARSQEDADEMVTDDPESYVDAESVLSDNYRYLNVNIDEIEVN